MSFFSEQLQSLRRQHDLSQNELAEKTGLTRSRISMYETAQREPDFETLELFADFFNVPMSSLISATGSVAPDNVMPMPQTYKVPLIGTIACGKPILALEEADDVVDVPEMIRADFALRCKGNSMINARIYDGDIVYIRSQPEVENGEIAAVLIDEEATLKRVHKFDDRLVLEAENPMYKPLVYWGNEMTLITILGKAVAFTSMVV